MNAQSPARWGTHVLAEVLYLPDRVAFASGEPVKLVPERLGHANATITLTVYQHVHPGWGARPPTGSPRC